MKRRSERSVNEARVVAHARFERGGDWRATLTPPVMCLETIVESRRAAAPRAPFCSVWNSNNSYIRMIDIPTTSLSHRLIKIDVEIDFYQKVGFN